MKKKRIGIKSKRLQALLRKGGREGMRKDFFELLRRAAKENPA